MGQYWRLRLGRDGHRVQRLAGRCHRGLLAGAFSLEGRRLCPTIDELAPEQLNQHLKPVAAEAVLCEQVRRVGLARDLAQVDALQAHGLLDPQRMCVQMPEFA